MEPERNQLQTLAVNIRKARDKKRLSQQALADTCNISKRTVQRIEKAECEPGALLLKKMCDVLETRIDDMLK